MNTVCKVDECKEKVSKRGYCNRHYLQMYRYGKILDIQRNRNTPQEFVIKRGQCKIPLYDQNGKLTTKAVIDAEDFELVKDYRFNYQGRRYVRISSKKSSFTFLHQLLLNTKWVDHKNGNSLDNRRKNLRPCTNQENQFNQKPRKGGTSKYKGVSFNKSRGKFYASIYMNGTSIHLGSFCKEIEAALIYNEAAKKYFGSFAKLNLI